MNISRYDTAFYLGGRVVKKIIFSILCICFFICNFYSVSAQDLDNLVYSSESVLIEIDSNYPHISNNPKAFQSALTVEYYISDYSYSCVPTTVNVSDTTNIMRVFDIHKFFTQNFVVQGFNMDVFKDGLVYLRGVDSFTFHSNFSYNGRSGACIYTGAPQDFLQTYTVMSDSCITIKNIGSSEYAFCPIASRDLVVSAPNTDNKLDSLNGLIINGNSTSNNSVNSNNQSNNKLDSTVNDFDNVENQYNENLKNELGKLNPTEFTPNSTKFLNAMTFVKVNFDILIKDKDKSYNPFGITLGFSLMLGLALLIIRKRL